MPQTGVQWAGALFALALLLRLAFVLIVDRDGFAFNDAFYYQSIAEQLSLGHGFANVDGDPTAQWPPVFPLLLSLVYRVFGAEPIAGELLNALIGAATVPLAFALARRAFGHREAVFTGLALALMPGQIFFTDVLLAETLYTFELVGLLYLLVVLPDRRWAYALIGAAIGVAALTRGEGVFLIVLPLVMWWGHAGGWRALGRRLAVVVGVAALVMAPWVLRNAIVVDAFVPTGTNSGSTFWSGHNPDADGGPTYPPKSLIRRVTETTNPAREVELSALLRREGLSYMTSHPLRELELIPLKLLSLNRGDSQAFFYWINPSGSGQPAVSLRATTVLGTLANAAYYGLLTLFVASLVVFGRAFLRTRLLKAILAWLAVSLVLYGFLLYGNFRYRVPLEPLMILVAAPLVARLGDLRVTPSAPAHPPR